MLSAFVKAKDTNPHEQLEHFTNVQVLIETVPELEARLILMEPKNIPLRRQSTSMIRPKAIMKRRQTVIGRSQKEQPKKVCRLSVSQNDHNVPIESPSLPADKSSSQMCESSNQQYGTNRNTAIIHQTVLCESLSTPQSDQQDKPHANTIELKSPELETTIDSSFNQFVRPKGILKRTHTFIGSHSQKEQRRKSRRLSVTINDQIEIYSPNDLDDNPIELTSRSSDVMHTQIVSGQHGENNDVAELKSTELDIGKSQQEQPRKIGHLSVIQNDDHEIDLHDVPIELPTIPAVVTHSQTEEVSDQQCEADGKAVEILSTDTNIIQQFSNLQIHSDSEANSGDNNKENKRPWYDGITVHRPVCFRAKRLEDKI
ncbi:uncharacterized protein LOC116341828 isoform X2 [Contarinia nasturtii]|nr:uncharacterized protein LOC116341828 isoform X2 [Contarinia nasturtii]